MMEEQEDRATDFYSKNYTPLYSLLECKRQLLSDFRNIYAQDITKILVFHKGQYAKAHRSLTSVLNEILKQCPEFRTDQKTKPVHISIALQNDDEKSEVFNIQTMATCRSCHKKLYLPPQLKQELAFVKEQMKISLEKTDRSLAMNLLEEEYMETGQLIECGCCFGNTVFDNMTQCMEGHLVCVECLNAFSKEIVFGAGKITLGCMTPNCTSQYPQSELIRCLSPATRQKLEERVFMENLNMAGVKDLVKCPYCDFAAILSPGSQVFECCRDNCHKRTCRDCGVDWNGHEGLACSEVEKQDETSLRKEYEEKMTRAKVRTCSYCKAQFTKEGGCNKMICRCGLTMCYICRKPKISYEHFCQHPRDPNKACTQCVCCSLWTNPEDDEERAIEEIREEARQIKKTLGFENERQIGVPAAKKFRK